MRKPTPETTALPADAARRLVADALAAGRIALAFQPVVCPGEGGRVAFFEGLFRILGADGAIVPAGVFIAAVEDHPLGRDLDVAALERGLATLASQPELRLAVNVSPHSIGDPRWAARVRDAAARDPGIPERLIVEVTERADVDTARMAAFMRELREIGVAFALDDFGAGYTSLRHFRELDFDIVKIDGSLVRDIDGDAGRQVMVAALLMVAAHFETLVVAEAVETAAEAETLARLGVGHMQGWLFGRPALELVPPALPDLRARSA